MQGAAPSISCLLLVLALLIQVAASPPNAPSKDAADAAAQLQADEFGITSPEVENMLEWMVENGGEVNVVVRTLPNKGRKVFAPQDLAAGDVLAEIPLDCCYSMRPKPAAVKERQRSCKSANELASFVTAVDRLWHDMHNHSSPHQAYFATLPKRDAVWSWYDIPESYLPLLQNSALGASIAGWEATLYGCSSSTGSSNTHMPPEIRIEDARYTLSLVTTRIFGPWDGGRFMQLIPLLDMADHRNDCPHTYAVASCSSVLAGKQVAPAGNGNSLAGKNETPAGHGEKSDKRCIVWTSGDSVGAGDEICNWYKFLLQDMSLLSYGYLQEGPVAQQLSRIDRHDFDPRQPWDVSEAVEGGGIPFEAVAPEQTAAELARLTQLLTDLTATDAELKPSMQPHARDTGGWFLQQLWLWRQQRQAAVAAEIMRLQRQLLRLEAAHRAVEEPKPQAVYDRLLAWVQESGAVVNVEVQAPAGITSPASACKADAASTSCSSSSSSQQRSQHNTHEQQAPVESSAETADEQGHSKLLDVRQQQQQQAVVAAHALKAGEVLAAIPVSLAYLIQGGSSDDIEEAALQILLDMQSLSVKPDSNSTANTPQPYEDAAVSSWAAFWQPFYAALPAYGSLKTMHNMPASYMPLLQHTELEHLVKDAALQTELSWAERLQASADAGSSSLLTLAELKHMIAVVSSRLQVLGPAGLGMLPLLDLARHDNACPHTTELEPCTIPPDTPAAPYQTQGCQDTANAASRSSCAAADEGVCMVWRAGGDVAAGQEVCSRHRGYLLPDVALLLHGMELPEQQQQQQQQLFAIDTSGVDLQELLGSPGVTPEPPPPFKPQDVEGIAGAAAAELPRLKQLLQSITSDEQIEAAGAMQPAAEDWGGGLLWRLHALRRQRIAAIEAEIGRIAAAVAHL